MPKGQSDAATALPCFQDVRGRPALRVLRRAVDASHRSLDCHHIAGDQSVQNNDLRSIHRSRRQHDRDPDVNMARTGAFVFTATNIPRLFLRVSMIRVLAVVTNRVLNH